MKIGQNLGDGVKRRDGNEAVFIERVEQVGKVIAVAPVARDTAVRLAFGKLAQSIILTAPAADMAAASAIGLSRC